MARARGGSVSGSRVGHFWNKTPPLSPTESLQLQEAHMRPGMQVALLRPRHLFDDLSESRGAAGRPAIRHVNPAGLNDRDTHGCRG